MASTLTSILVHATFSTKHREPMIPLDIRADIFAYMGGIARSLRSPLLHAGGVGDHVHLLINLGKTVAMADLMQEVKRGGSVWMKQQPGCTGFGWQDGYFAFSVGHDGVDAVRVYFDQQEEHHRTISFQSEVLAFFRKYGVEYDEQYVWE